MRSHPGIACGLFAAALVFGAWAGPSHGATVVATIDSAGDVGWYTSMRLNAGNPVISYYDSSKGDLKVATCTAECTGTAPTWVVTAVDQGGDVGWYTSLELNQGNPAVAYYDVTNGRLKLATCVTACATSGANWVVAVVDGSNADVGRFPSLKFDAGRPLISYRDKTNGDLKLATCTAACTTSAPTWVIATVDSAGDVGRYSAMQLDSGRPVIAYFDLTSGTVKLATCTAACASVAASWVITTVDTVPGDAETQISLQLGGGNPVISYYDKANGDLKVATCTSACASTAPTWVRNVVDAGGDAGEYSSLQLQGGNPVVAYMGTFFACTRGTLISCHTATDLRLAVCTADCATADAKWVLTTVDNSGLAGYDPSLQLDGNRVVVSYYDLLHGDLKVAVGDLAAASIPPNYTALWWNFDQSGWGINFTHQGDIVFGTLFTYDSAGAPMWLVLPSASRQPGTATYSGALYRTTGPAFNATPFVPIGPSNYREVGSMTVMFAGDSATLSYTVDGVVVEKVIRKLVFGSHAADCRPATGSRASLTNYQDLWWNSAESGWGINLTHQDDIIFATLFTYDASGRGLWLVMSGARRQADGSYLGDLYRTTGPAFNATPFEPIGPSAYTKVGAMTLRFENGERGTLSYSVDGANVVKQIERIVLATPYPACSS